MTGQKVQKAKDTGLKGPGRMLPFICCALLLSCCWAGFAQNQTAGKGKTPEVHPAASDGRTSLEGSNGRKDTRVLADSLAKADSGIIVRQLNNSIVVAAATPVKVVEDTVEYNPAAYRLAEDAMLEDILRRIPGLNIENGVVTLHGKEVKQLLVNGQRFFAGDIKAGMQNISADIVAKVNAYERESDFTRATGIDDGERETVLDLKIKKNIMGGWTGNLTGAYGLHNRYVAKANLSKIDKNKQLSILGNFNNVNGTININNASRNQLGGGGGGDAHKRELGLNYAKNSSKLKIDASVHYSGNNRDLQSTRSVERIYAGGITGYEGQTAALNMANVPKFEARIEWTPSRKFSLLVKPSFKYTNNDNFSHSWGDNTNMKQQWKSGVDNYSKLSQSIFAASLGMIATFRNVGEKRGRSLSLSLTPSFYGNMDKDGQSYHTIYKSSETTRKVFVDAANSSPSASIQLSYSEPLGKGFFIQGIIYSQYVLKTSVRNVYDTKAASTAAGTDWTVQQALPQNYLDFILNDISTEGKYTLLNNYFSVNMRYNRKKINLTAGVRLSPQFSWMNFHDENGVQQCIRKKAFFVSPNLNFVYRPKKTERLSLSYNAYASAPSMYNLLPVSNGTNPLYVHNGNADLLPVYTHKIDLSYNVSNAAHNNSVVVNARAKILENSVSNMTVYDEQTGGTITTPYNINGNWNAQASMAYNQLLPLGFTLVQHASFDFFNTNNYLYDSSTRVTDTNTMRRAMLKESLDVQWRNSWLEVIANISADLTSETSTLRKEMNQMPYSFATGIKLNAVCPWKMRISLDYSFLLQRGYRGEAVSELNRNYNVLNASISQPFLRNKLILSINAYDTLGQLPNLTRSFSQSNRSISLFNGYNRYFLVRLIYKFKVKKTD